MDSYQQTLHLATLIIADRMSPKIMRLDNGNFIKLFRRKKLISTALFSPHALRFANNALRLKTLGIATIAPLNITYCTQNKMHIVEYKPLAGSLLRDILQTGDMTLMPQLIHFIAHLHQLGIYFRSLHFGNIIWNGKQLGLIDIADMKIYQKPLSPRLRKRNHQHYLRYEQDNSIIKQYDMTRFMREYDAASKNIAAQTL